jgi:hypothetical protein
VADGDDTTRPRRQGFLPFFYELAVQWHFIIKITEVKYSYMYVTYMWSNFRKI